MPFDRNLHFDRQFLISHNNLTMKKPKTGEWIGSTSKNEIRQNLRPMILLKDSCVKSTYMYEYSMLTYIFKEFS